MEDGTDCYCGAAGEDFGKNGPLGEESCATLCDANPDSTCGGLDAIEVRRYLRRRRDAKKHHTCHGANGLSLRRFCKAAVGTHIKQFGTQSSQAVTSPEVATSNNPNPLLYRISIHACVQLTPVVRTTLAQRLTAVLPRLGLRYLLLRSFVLYCPPKKQNRHTSSKTSFFWDIVCAARG